MTNNDQEQASELSAYLLGELSSGQKQALEQIVAESEELQAELDALSGDIEYLEVNLRNQAESSKPAQILNEEQLAKLRHEAQQQGQQNKIALYSSSKSTQSSPAKPMLFLGLCGGLAAALLCAVLILFQNNKGSEQNSSLSQQTKSGETVPSMQITLENSEQPSDQKETLLEGATQPNLPQINNEGAASLSALSKSLPALRAEPVSPANPADNRSLLGLSGKEGNLEATDFPRAKNMSYEEYEKQLAELRRQKALSQPPTLQPKNQIPGVQEIKVPVLSSPALPKQ